MTEKLKASIGVFWINTICTLKCKKCITLTPYHRKPMNFPKENIFLEIDKFFEIYECIDHFDIEGGESLLHPDLNEILEKALTYKARFNRLHVLTNGTLLPSQKLVDVCKKNDIFFIIDDYGDDLSVKKEELMQVLEENDIPYRVDIYHGENQYYGGWVDFGDMQYKNYSDEEIKNVFSNCRQAICNAPYIKNGKIFLCSIQAAGVEYIPLVEGEYVDLVNENIPLSQRIEIAKVFGEKPLGSCKYCMGFNVNAGKRYAAAEQLPNNMDKELKICL